jgi:hypothetical protein
VVAPKKYVESGAFTQEGLEDITRDWAVKNMAGKRGGILRYSSLVASEEGDTLDVMILLGGFSLKKILSKTLQKYYDFKDSLKMNEREVELADENNPRIKVKINIKDIDTIESGIKEYIALTEERIKRAKKEEMDIGKKLVEWGFGK